MWCKTAERPVAESVAKGGLNLAIGERGSWIGIAWGLVLSGSWAVAGCGPADSDSGTGGASSGGAATGGSTTGGSVGTGGDPSGGAAADGGSSVGGTAPSTGGSSMSGGAESSGGSGALPNWESNPPDAEFFRACLDPSGHEIVLRVKTPDGCTELTLTDIVSSCLPLQPESGWCVSNADFYLNPALCDEAGLTGSANPTNGSLLVNDEIMVSDGGRLDAIFSIEWSGGYTPAPSGISVSGCIANCEERDCREQ